MLEKKSEMTNFDWDWFGNPAIGFTRVPFVDFSVMDNFHFSGDFYLDK